MRDRICVVIQNFNQKELTLLRLKSLSEISYKLRTIALIDHGSSDGSVEAVRLAHPNVPIFEEKHNLGIVEGNNQAIRWALGKPFKWIALLDAFTSVDPEILSSWMETAKDNPDAKIFGAKIYRAEDRDRIDHLGGYWDEKLAQLESISWGPTVEESSVVDYVSAKAFLLHRDVPESIGFFDKRLSTDWCEADYCFRALRKGFLTKTSPLTKVWCTQTLQNQYLWTRSRLLWLKKNLAPSQSKAISKKIIYHELKNIINKLKFNKNELTGIAHYYLNRFHN
jgi:GT2 family glycosyltransferase